MVLGLGMTPGLRFYWESLVPWGEGCRGSHCPLLCPDSQTEAHLECPCSQAFLPQGLLAAGSLGRPGVTTAHTALCASPQPGHPAGGHCQPQRAGTCPAHSPTKILAGSGIPQLGGRERGIPSWLHPVLSGTSLVSEPWALVGWGLCRATGEGCPRSQAGAWAGADSWHRGLPQTPEGRA